MFNPHSIMILILMCVPVTAFAQSGKVLPENAQHEATPKVECFLTENEPIDGVTRPEPIRSPYGIYAHHEPIFTLSKKHVRNCWLFKETASVVETIWRWRVEIELTEEAKAELGRRFRALQPKKTYQWAVRLNGKDWFGESIFRQGHNQFGKPRSAFEEVIVLVTRDRSEAERVKTTFLEPAKPLAHFLFNDDFKDIAAADSQVSAQNAKFHERAFDPKDGYFRVKTPSLNYRSFSVALRFKAANDGSGSIPILSCGPQTGWFQMQITDGNLTVHFKSGDTRFRSTDINAGPIKAGQWYDLVCCARRREGEVRLYLNGQALKPQWIPSAGSAYAESLDIGDRKFRIIPTVITGSSFHSNAIRSESEKEWMFRDPNSGTAFDGLVDELVIFDRALTEHEALGLPLGR